MQKEHNIKKEDHFNHLEILITSVNYGDFLDQTLPFTLPHADRVVVVTSFDDEHTQQICRKWSVECVPTDTFTEKGESFNKGNAINIGLAMLRNTGWVLHMDADIVLPITTRNMLGKSGLHKDCIYGSNRLNVTGWEAWEKLKRNWHDNPQFGYSCLVNSSEEHPVGATLVHKQYGYCPIGCFQLWHSSYVNRYQLRYPDVAGSAEHADVQWALRWPRQNRVLLPTIRVFHLESEKCKMGTNWNGRQTKEFSPHGHHKHHKEKEPCKYYH